MNGCHSVASARTCRIRFRNIVISHLLACQGISYTLNPFKRISFCMLFMNKKCWNACHPRAIAKTHFIIANKALRLSYKTRIFVSPICNTIQIYIKTANTLYFWIELQDIVSVLSCNLHCWENALTHQFQIEVTQNHSVII